MSSMILNHVRHTCLAGPERSLPLHATLVRKQWFRNVASRHLTWFVFVRDDEEPRFIVRQTVNPAGNNMLLREARIMEEIAASGQVSMIPRVLDITTLGGLATVTSEYIHGSHSIATEIARAYRTGELETEAAEKLFVRHFSQAAGALSALRQVPAEPLATGKRDSEAGLLLHEALSWFGKERRYQMGLTQGALELLFETSVNHATAGNGIVHFDFTPANLLLSNDRVILVDWESARRSSFWWFDPLKFVYWYIVDLASFLEDMKAASDPVGAFLFFLEGGLGRLTGPVNSFLQELGFPVRERDTMRAFWLGYVLCELKVVLRVSEAPLTQLEPYGRLIGGIVDLGSSTGYAGKQLEHLQGEHACADEERSRRQEEIRSLKGLLANERKRSSELAKRLEEVHGELRQIWNSKLWKIGSLYWRIRSNLGLSSRGKQ